MEGIPRLIANSFKISDMQNCLSPLVFQKSANGGLATPGLVVRHEELSVQLVPGCAGDTRVADRFDCDYDPTKRMAGIAQACQKRE
ncbi:hypothetical protein [Bradyrhizobium sp. SBR1B]|uniref:hypothetical protein n=1 Tax=Bradyrhizobium sp. SBR1B TaxID=2663836 RepID=UPI00160618C4|nr:hypothetical protein [Bradyrhizobium sp. SBR1B]MBB4381441.1 hypothetical protein [Bradyrhizobium sp. SBR1B]